MKRWRPWPANKESRFPASACGGRRLRSTAGVGRLRLRRSRDVCYSQEEGRRSRPSAPCRHRGPPHDRRNRYCRQRPRRADLSAHRGSPIRTRGDVHLPVRAMEPQERGERRHHGRREGGHRPLAGLDSQRGAGGNAAPLPRQQPDGGLRRHAAPVTPRFSDQARLLPVRPRLSPGSVQRGHHAALRVHRAAGRHRREGRRRLHARVALPARRVQRPADADRTRLRLTGAPLPRDRPGHSQPG